MADGWAEYHIGCDTQIQYKNSGFCTFLSHLLDTKTGWFTLIHSVSNFKPYGGMY